jgi:DNA-binding response OmpR family regulator
MKILIVDDENDFTVYLCRFLKRKNHEVLVAEDGQKGIEFFQEFQPDWVILDYNLPKLNGIEVLTRIKQTKPGCKVAFITGAEDESVGKKVMELGATVFMNKPIELDKIEQLLEKT